MCADHTKPAEVFCGFTLCALQAFTFLCTSFQTVWSSALCIVRAFITILFLLKKEKKNTKMLKNRNGIFFLNLMAEVSCVELFNVMEPAAETLCDSCSLLKICTRELFLGGSVCVCPTWHDDWWERGWDVKFSCWNDVHVDSWKASGELAHSITTRLAVHLKRHWGWSFIRFKSWYTLKKYL